MTHTVAGIILEVSRQLNDQDAQNVMFAFTRWSREDLLEYYNDALVQVSIYRPDVLITSGYFPNFSPGRVQQLPSYASELLSIDYAFSFACQDQFPLTRVDFAFSKAYYKESCITPLYRPYNWAYEPFNPRIYYILPAVPGGIQIAPYATYKGIVPIASDPNTNAEIPYPIKYHGALVSWMQKRAYERDQESISSFKLAVQHYQEFNKALGVSVETDRALHMKKFLPPART